MLYKNVELFNVSEIEKMESGAVRLHRFPKEVRQSLGRKDEAWGRYMSKLTTGCEIRYVTESFRVCVSLSAIDEDGEVLVYCGDYLHKRVRLQKGVESLLVLDDSKLYDKGVKHEAINSGRFSPNVWRIIFCHDFICQLNYIDSNGYGIRPPMANELPKKRWLAYGSSITHGACAQLHTNAYIMSASRKLGVDVLEKGMHGSCLCENVMADYLAKEEWDFITLEIGVNMKMFSTTEELSQRLNYLMNQIKKYNPNKPVILITIFPNFATHYTEEYQEEIDKENSFNKAIRDVYNAYKHDNNTYLVEGSDVLKSFDWLTTDLIHPSEYGHFMMGIELASQIKDYI